VSDKDTCPLRVTLLNMIVAGEYSPHLDVSEECPAFVAAATDAVTAFTDRGDVERAVEARIDAFSPVLRRGTGAPSSSPHLSSAGPSSSATCGAARMRSTVPIHALVST
jgi:hypothetical protein